MRTFVPLDICQRVIKCRFHCFFVPFSNLVLSQWRYHPVSKWWGKCQSPTALVMACSHFDSAGPLPTTDRKMTVRNQMRGTWLTATIAILSMLSVQSFATDCGGGYSCPGDDTCCSSDSGPPSCCIFPKATCCSDHVHCCPPSYPICDLKHQRCRAYSNSAESQAYMKQLIQDMFVEGKKDQQGNRISWLPWFGNMMHTQSLRGNNEAPTTRPDENQDADSEWPNRLSIPLMDTLPANRRVSGTFRK